MKKKWILIGAGALVVVVGSIGAVSMKGRGQKTPEVQTAKATRQKIVQKVNGTGKIQPRVQVKISADVSAKITKLAEVEGQRVEKGAFLLELDREADAALRRYVQERLAGKIATPTGKALAGPAVAWKGRRHGPRQHRRWSRAWSPEQIAHRLPIDFPDDTSMRICHEAIYQALYIRRRGALRRELTACLRTGRALRVPRERTRGRGKSFVTPEILISERPAAVDDRAIPGHWEGDLIVGVASSAIGTLVERTTRFTMLLHLPPLPEHGQQPRDKHGPALAGHGAAAVRDAITRAIGSLPEQLRLSLTIC